MREELAGLSIGEDSACVARIRVRHGGALEVVALAVEPLRADAGEREVGAALKALWRKADVGTRTVACCLHARTVVYKPGAFPDLQPSELRAAAALDAEQALQLPAADLLVDWRPNPGDAQSRTGLLVALPRREVERSLAALRLAGLYPVALDGSCLAVASLFRRLRPQAVQGRVVCLTHMGARSGETVILYGDGALYARAVHARKGVDVAEYLFSSLKDVLKYFQFKLHHRPVEEMIFTGSLGDTAVFESRAAVQFGVPVSLWNPVDDLSLTPAARLQAPRRGWQFGVAPALGLALRGLGDG